MRDFIEGFLMRHPLWILNSTLFLCVIVALGFILVSRQPEPTWESVEPSTQARPLAKKVSEINISKIYDYDLFDTYQRTFPDTTRPDYVMPFPEPPQPQPVEIPQEPKPQFLEPLKITLKGIIVVSNDDSKNRAIVMDTTTKHESIHKVGDTIEDAQLIKIFNNKVIFLRANGQQEVLYLRQKDAQLDPTYAVLDGWKGVAQQIGDNHYLISKKEITNHITSLANFIDLLEITTVYQQGKSIGCRIGNISRDSLGAELGLYPGDIITHVNDIPATDTHDRLVIYKKIVGMQTKDTIAVHLLRRKVPMTVRFTLLDELPVIADSSNKSGEIKQTPQQIANEQVKLLQEQYKLAPTLRDIRTQERNNMLQKGKIQRNNLTSKFTQVDQGDHEKSSV